MWYDSEPYHDDCCCTRSPVCVLLSPFILVHFVLLFHSFAFPLELCHNGKVLRLTWKHYCRYNPASSGYRWLSDLATLASALDENFFFHQLSPASYSSNAMCGKVRFSLALNVKLNFFWVVASLPLSLSLYRSFFLTRFGMSTLPATPIALRNSLICVFVEPNRRKI